MSLPIALELPKILDEQLRKQEQLNQTLQIQLETHLSNKYKQIIELMKEKNELSMRVICYYYSLYNLFLHRTEIDFPKTLKEKYFPCRHW